MAEQKVKIIAECVCDLPRGFFKEHNVDIVYFSIETESGVFADTSEITSENIIEYMQRGGKKALSCAPSPETYKAVFSKNLELYDEIILVTISSKISMAFKNSTQAVSEMKTDKVHVFDSWHLSSGLGHFVIKAAKMAENGCSSGEILAVLEKMRPSVSTSFIVESTDYLYKNGKVSRKVKELCDKFDIHPILEMREGALVIQSITRGNYKKACRKYIKKTLKKSKNIDKTTAFITHAGCSSKTIDFIKNEIEQIFHFDNLVVKKASATISSNCGPNTFGILFIRE